MKKFAIIISIFAMLGVAAVHIPSAAAIDVLNPSGTQGPCNNPNATSKPELCNDNQSSSGSSPITGPNGILTAVINLMSLAVGIISVVVIVIAGFRMVLAGGDANAAAAARRTVIYAVTALMIALVAQAIVALVLSKV
ncbi:MAG TPA: hypothetical protein VLH86_01455 [Patescibacteria group bacterium]|nr:hypothetical protein [Patescibacteria group bacterium]